MKLSEKTQKALGRLTMWENGSYLYNLYQLKDIELHGSFEECEIVEEWFEEDFRAKGNDFLEFGYNRAGDPYALWIYPELKGEPAVVLLDSDGEVEMLAPSLNDYLCLLTNYECITGQIDNDKIHGYEIYKFDMEDLINDDFKDLEAVKNKLKEEIALINKHQECRSVSEIIKDFDRHPNFKEWFDERFAL